MADSPPPSLPGNVTTQWVWTILKRRVAVPLWLIGGLALFSAINLIAEINLMNLVLLGIFVVAVFAVLTGKLPSINLPKGFTLPTRGIVGAAAAETMLAKDAATLPPAFEGHILAISKLPHENLLQQVTDLVNNGDVPVCLALKLGGEYEPQALQEVAAVLARHPQFRCIAIVEKTKKYRGHVPKSSFPSLFARIGPFCRDIGMGVMPGEIFVAYSHVPEKESTRATVEKLRLKGQDHLAVTDEKERLVGFATAEALGRRILGF